MSTEQVKLSTNQQAKLDSITTKSGKIRYLTTLKWSRRQIADKVGVIYQFVRNVQVNPVPKNPRP